MWLFYYDVALPNICFDFQNEIQNINKMIIYLIHSNHSETPNLA